MIPICDYQAFGPPTSKPNRNIYFISLTFTTLEGVCSFKAFPSRWLCLGSHNWSATKCLWCDLPQRKESNLQLDWIQRRVCLNRSKWLVFIFQWIQQSWKTLFGRLIARRNWIRLFSVLHSLEKLNLHFLKNRYFRQFLLVYKTKELKSFENRVTFKTWCIEKIFIFLSLYVNFNLNIFIHWVLEPKIK